MNTNTLQHLVDAFKQDSITYKDIKTPENTQEQRNLLRSLMNIREPGLIDGRVLKMQDDYLTEVNKEKGIVDVDELDYSDHMTIYQGDITTLKADAIVNAANNQMLGCFIPMHTCIDNCIHTYAGIELRNECNQKMHELRRQYGEDYVQPTAVPMLTKGYNLPAEHVIHVVGPIVEFRVTKQNKEDLVNVYKNVLDMCAENNLKSVVFCCISTGVFHFPNKMAAHIAVKMVKDWLKEHPGKVERVVFNVFKDEDRQYYEEELSA